MLFEIDPDKLLKAVAWPRGRARVGRDGVEHADDDEE
jgi:hypothetical protein